MPRGLVTPTAYCRPALQVSPVKLSIREKAKRALLRYTAAAIKVGLGKWRGWGSWTLAPGHSSGALYGVSQGLQAPASLQQLVRQQQMPRPLGMLRGHG